MRWVTYRTRPTAATMLGSRSGTRSAVSPRPFATPIGVLDLAGAVLGAPLPDPPSIRDVMAFEEHVVTSTEALGATVDPVWGRPARWGDGAWAVRSPGQAAFAFGAAAST